MLIPRIRRTHIALAALALAAGPAVAATPMDGAWVVDLTAKPGDAPYTQQMMLTLAADGTVNGRFYNSDVLAGRWKKDRGRTCVSFRTTDDVGFYHTAACLLDDGVQGQTWAEQRKFLFNWNAVRAK